MTRAAETLPAETPPAESNTALPTLDPERRSAGERLAQAVMEMTPGWRARMSRSGQTGVHDLELEALVERAGLGWLRGAARDRVLETLAVMCGQLRGTPRRGARRWLGEALRERDLRGGKAGERALSRLGVASSETLPLEVRRAAQLVGPWELDWALPLDLAVRWDDPARRSELIRTAQRGYLGVRRARPEAEAP